LCIRRIHLDAVLFANAAETTGVEAVEGARVTEILRDGPCVTGVRYETRAADGHAREFSATADLVAGCDGRRSLVANAVDAPAYVMDPPINFAFYTYVQDAEPGPDPEPMFEVWDSGTIGGTPMIAECEAGVYMAIVYLPQRGFDAFRRNKDQNFWQAMDSDPRIGPRLRTGTQLTPIKGAGDFVNFIREPVGNGWALVGDAGQFKDPIFGQGIGDAARSAEALADCLLEAASSGSHQTSALGRYRVKRDLDLVPNYRWMIQRHPADMTPDDFESIWTRLGSDPDQAERFVNVFSHAVSSSEFFGRLNASSLLGTDPRSFDGRRLRSSETTEAGR
jgi:flavin-dependent dehydrogenase